MKTEKSAKLKEMKQKAIKKFFVLNARLYHRSSLKVLSIVSLLFLVFLSLSVMDRKTVLNQKEISISRSVCSDAVKEVYVVNGLLSSRKIGVLCQKKEMIPIICITKELMSGKEEAINMDNLKRVFKTTDC